MRIATFCPLDKKARGIVILDRGQKPPSDKFLSGRGIFGHGAYSAPRLAFVRHVFRTGATPPTSTHLAIAKGINEFVRLYSFFPPLNIHTPALQDSLFLEMRIRHRSEGQALPSDRVFLCVTQNTAVHAHNHYPPRRKGLGCNIQQLKVLVC